MISVIIPTLNAERTLPRTFATLVSPMVRGVIREVIVADGGSTDETALIADGAGAHFVSSRKGRGQQLKAGAAAAKGEWLLFLHADTVLERGWDDEVIDFMERAGALERPTAAAFRFALDDFRFKARVLEKIVSLRCWLLKMPYGDQGLLISRRHYERLGGFRDMDLMEDVDMVRRIGRGQLTILRSAAVTSANRYKRRGYLVRVLQNFFILTLYFCRVPPRLLVRLYG